MAFYGCREDITIEEPHESLPPTRAEVYSPEHYYWSNGERIPLTVNENKLFVLTETAKYENVSKLTMNAGAQIGSVRTMENHAPLGVKNAKMQRSLTSFTLDNTNLKSIDTENLVYVAPYFRTTDGADIGITNVFSVRLEGEKDLIKLEKIAKENNLEMLGRNESDRSIYYLSCTKESNGNALEMANYIYESGAFEYATPEFIIESREDGIIPNDLRSGQNGQWNLRNVTYPDIDINYFDLVNYFDFPNIGNIIVAVVDSGVYTGHEDLSVYASYDAHAGISRSYLYGDHGTEVAGVFGAKTNNGIGIAAVAPGVKIMSISLCSSTNATRLGIQPSTTTNYANAIRWAADHGAHVINNSWTFETTAQIPEIYDAIVYAFLEGCVVVFSSGNNNGPILQPAAGVPDPILVVGAINKSGRRSNKAFNKSSSYGSALDVVAPGEDIWTTINNTPTGYNTTDGTSVAAPHVSGIAALIMSKFPSLTAEQVAAAIEKSARQVGGYGYWPEWSRSYGLWHSEMGYGLVDAYQAMVEAEAMAVIPPAPGLLYDESNEFPGGFIKFTVHNPQPGTTYEWDIIHGQMMYTSGSTLYVYCPYVPFGGTGDPYYGQPNEYEWYIIVACRAIVNGVASAWSNKRFVLMDYFIDM